MRLLAFIGMGGFIGSIARYGLQQLMYRWMPVAFPLGTLSVNVLGSFLIGLFYGMAHRGNWLNDEWRSFLIIGICGGFTTFSTFSFETSTLLRDGHYLNAFSYILSSVVLCVVATIGGMALLKYW